MLLAEPVLWESFWKDPVLHKSAASEQCELYWPSASVFSNTLSVEVKSFHLCIAQYIKQELGTREMAWHLRVRTAPAKVKSSVPYQGTPNFL